MDLHLKTGSTPMSEKPISPLRRRMIEDMTVRNFVAKTRNDYIRHVRTFTAFLGRSAARRIHRKGLAPSTSCRSPGALRNPAQERSLAVSARYWRPLTYR